MPPFDNAKHPTSQSLNWFTEEKISAAQTLLAKSWPVSVVEVLENNAVVKVKIDLRTELNFPILTCPVASPSYVRWPIQEGDKGVVFCADYAIWGASGLSTSEGVPDLSAQFNSANGVFFPIGNKKFDDVENQKQMVLSGPEGVVLKATAAKPKARANVPAGGETKVVIDQDGMKVFIDGTLKFIVDAAGARFIGGSMPGGGNFGIDITAGGTLVDGVNFLPHQHVGVETGASNTGAVDDT